MIVKNEAHIVHEALAGVAPHIDYWVIVDTGSDDGTQDVIRATMAELDIPGELQERPWRNFGHNRTEALQLAGGHCDYIWVMDADDVLVGRPDFSELSADGYLMLIEEGHSGLRYWRLQLFRDRVAWRYSGVTHEFAHCDEEHTEERLPGDYFILYRELGSNSQRSGKFERDRELLLTEIHRNPDDSRAAFYLARTYECLCDWDNALKWYRRRALMGGWDEEVYCAMYKSADMMNRLGNPWPDVLNAFLTAWAYRPTRAEGLHSIATHYRTNGEYELGYIFAARAAQIDFPESDILPLFDISRWRALDEQSVCASWIGRTGEALTLCRQVLTFDEIPVDERQRNLENRDALVVQSLHSCAVYTPDLARRPLPRRDAEVTVSLSTGPDQAPVERTLNSFLRCCSDHSRVGRILVIDAGLTAAQRETLVEKYPFLDFFPSHDADLNVVRREIGGRYWLHLWHGWQFFTNEALIGRLIDVLESEAAIYQVGINFRDALRLGPDSPARSGVRTTSSGSRYVLSDTATAGPAMFEMTRLRRLLEKTGDDMEPCGPTATLDEVLCVHNP